MARKRDDYRDGAGTRIPTIPEPDVKVPFGERCEVCGVPGLHTHTQAGEDDLNAAVAELVARR